MKKVLLISPHFDDAVLSAGQFMAERPDCEVVTVFAGMPLTPERVVTPYDEKCGFKNAQDAMAERQRENSSCRFESAVEIACNAPARLWEGSRRLAAKAATAARIASSISFSPAR